MLNIDWLEWLGYLASLLVLISLIMSSIIKLRIINLVGSSLFATYGFLIGAIPVGIVNLCIAIVNVYYLSKMKSPKEYFNIIPIDKGSEYLEHFLNFYEEDIKKMFHNHDVDSNKSSVGFYVLRDMVPAGVFMASKYGEDSLIIDLDFVIPEYTDFKIGRYIYEENKDYFLNAGYNKIYSYPGKENFNNYLERMGFDKIQENGKDIYFKTL